LGLGRHQGLNLYAVDGGRDGRGVADPGAVEDEVGLIAARRGPDWGAGVGDGLGAIFGQKAAKLATAATGSSPRSARF
jgi:hypothetical protein